MRRNLVGLLAFSVTVALFVAGLKLVNRIPLAVRDDTLRRYGDIEEVRTRLAIREIGVPSYFPQNLGWPPSSVYAQGTPFPAVVMEFEKVAGRGVVLVVCQAASDDFRPDGKLELTTIRDTADVPVKGRPARLQVGACRGGETCTRMSWRDGRFRFTLIARLQPFELIRIAESVSAR